MLNDFAKKRVTRLLMQGTIKVIKTVNKFVTVVSEVLTYVGNPSNFFGILKIY